MPKSSKENSLEKKSTTLTVLQRFKAGDLIFGLKDFHRKKIIAELRKQEYEYIFSNELNEKVVDKVIEEKDKICYKPTRERIAHFHYLKKQKEYLCKPGGKKLLSMPNQFKLGAAFRRACKLLVRNANPKRRIHFELDGMDIKRVCDSSATDLGVTNSELKAAYRQAKEIEVNPYIFFYDKGISCPAPWDQEEYKADWERYDAARLAKKSK